MIEWQSMKGEKRKPDRIDTELEATLQQEQGSRSVVDHYLALSTSCQIR